MEQKRTKKQYSKEYKEEAVALVKEQWSGYTIPYLDDELLYHLERIEHGKPKIPQTA